MRDWRLTLAFSDGRAPCLDGLPEASGARAAAGSPEVRGRERTGRRLAGGRALEVGELAGRKLKHEVATERFPHVDLGLLVKVDKMKRRAAPPARRNGLLDGIELITRV
jgi:hypothetical protein